MRIQFLLKNTGMYERLGIMTLSSILKQNGHEVKLLLTEELGEKKIVENVKISKPHVLAYSIMTGEHSYHIELNRMVRSHYNNALSVFGGPHPTYNPEMINMDYVDAICRGEGEIYFLQLIEKLERGEDFYDTQNFWFKKKDGSGRVGAFEVMVCNSPIKNLIREAKIHQIPSVMQTGQREGMITMEKSIEDLIGTGVISNAEKNN